MGFGRTCSRLGHVALAVLMTTIGPRAALGQDEQIDPAVRDEARRILADAESHVTAERWAMAAQAYQRLYEFMSAHSLTRACVAQWNRGLALMRIPGHEREARDAFQRFLTESTPLTEDAQVRDWRSTALEHIAELDARLGAALSQDTATEPAERAGGGVNPVGPVVLGLGALVLATGGALGGIVLGQDAQLAAMCSDGRCPEAARPLVQEQERLALSADVLVITGAATALTGLLLTILVRDASPEGAAGTTGACGPLGCHLAGWF